MTCVLRSLEKQQHNTLCKLEMRVRVQGMQGMKSLRRHRAREDSSTHATHRKVWRIFELPFPNGRKRLELLPHGASTHPHFTVQTMYWILLKTQFLHKSSGVNPVAPEASSSHQTTPLNLASTQLSLVQVQPKDTRDSCALRTRSFLREFGCPRPSRPPKQTRPSGTQARIDRPSHTPD